MLRLVETGCSPWQEDFMGDVGDARDRHEVGGTAAKFVQH
jgi:hypothetical protein